jgi:Uma2 family endonuclease
MSVIATPNVRPSVHIDPVVEPEDVLYMDEKGLFELVDGRLIEKKLSILANLIAGRIIRLLGNHVESSGTGALVLPEQSFQCFAHEPKQLRRPDIALIAAGRLPMPLPTGHVKIIPDLAVEVISPNDNVYELEDKLADYRLAGFPLTWVVYPEARLIRIHRPRQPVDELFDGDVLTGGTALPGFKVNITDLLPPNPPAGS